MGVKVESPRKDKLVRCREGKEMCHPFCRSPIVEMVKHTDVLILDQFVDSRGEMTSRDELGICKAVDQTLQTCSNGTTGRTDAWKGILLLRTAPNKVGLAELLLGRKNNRHSIPQKREKEKAWRHFQWEKLQRQLKSVF